MNYSDPSMTLREGVTDSLTSVTDTITALGTVITDISAAVTSVFDVTTSSVLAQQLSTLNYVSSQFQAEADRLTAIIADWDAAS